MSKINTMEKIALKKEQEPIDIRIAKAVCAAKKVSERIFGYIRYDIKFVKATYKGVTRRPAKITALEKGIVGVLLVDETASFEKIGTILGLNVVDDKAEQVILRKAVKTLQGFKAVEGDDSCLVLTDGGRAYAEKGERPDLYEKSFDIFVDTLHPSWLNIKNCIGDNVKTIDKTNTSCGNLNLNLEQIKAYAECQAQDVHCPQNRYFLTSAIWDEGYEASYKVYVCFVQNVATGGVRAFVYDEKQGGLNNLIAEQININDSLKTELLSNCIRLECEKNEECEVLEGQAIEVAMAEIPAELKEAERKMIDAEEAEYAENGGVKEKRKDHLYKNALYDTWSFEVELQKIFREDDPDEIWLISPWIKVSKAGSVFIERRGPEIKQFLRDNRKRVFVAYSEPERKSSGEFKTNERGCVKKNIDDDALKFVMELERQYPNFFYVELPEFHLKNVIEVKGDQQILFTGSYNVLSFCVSQGQTHIRKEEMALLPQSITNEKYTHYLCEFAESYSKRIKEQITALDDSEVSTYKTERLDYFLSIDNSKIRELFLPIKDLLEEKYLANTKREIMQKLIEIEKKFNMSGLDFNDRKYIEDLLAKIELELKNNNIDDPLIEESLRKNKDLLNNVREKKIFRDRKCPNPRTYNL